MEKEPQYGIRHPHRSGTSRTQGCRAHVYANYHDLHPRAKPRNQRRAQPTG